MQRPDQAASTADENDQALGARFSADEPPKPGHAQSRRWRLRHWRLRSRLVTLLVIPLVLAGALAGLRLAASVGDIQDLAAAQDKVALGQQVARVTDALQTERHLAAAAVASQAVGQRALVAKQIQQVDSEVAALRELQGDAQSLTGSAALAYGEVLSRLDALDALREKGPRC